MDLAYAVVRTDPPLVYAAEDVDVLHRVIALEVVARTPAANLPAGTVQDLRQALLDERWGDAVERWMAASHTALDVYPRGLPVRTAAELEATMASVRLQFTPLFTDA
jgi:hypothetical protein